MNRDQILRRNDEKTQDDKQQEDFGKPFYPHLIGNAGDSQSTD